MCTWHVCVDDVCTWHARVDDVCTWHVCVDDVCTWHARVDDVCTWHVCVDASTHHVSQQGKEHKHKKDKHIKKHKKHKKSHSDDESADSESDKLKLSSVRPCVMRCMSCILARVVMSYHMYCLAILLAALLQHNCVITSCVSVSVFQSDNISSYRLILRHFVALKDISTRVCSNVMPKSYTHNLIDLFSTPSM